MHNAEQILDWSTIAVTAISLLAMSNVALSSYGATLGTSKFKYRFDKARIPACIYATIALAVLSFSYSLLIGGQVDAAIVYGLLMSFPGTIAILLRIGYVPK